VKRWFVRILRVALAAFVLLILAVAVEIIAGWHCNLQGQLHPPEPRSAERQKITDGIPNYLRPEDDTFLSYPEWYIVWSYQEKADFQEHKLPSGFPYLGAVRQYWGSYCGIFRLIHGKYSANFGEQLMLVVIGTSFSAEYILKGAYEKTLGAFSEWTSGNQPTEEDKLAYQVAREYADFVHVRPFYEFHFARQTNRLWKTTPLFGAHNLRKWERKLYLTLDYTAEAFYCWIIEKLTHVTYGFEPSETYAWIENTADDALSGFPRVKVVKEVGRNAFIVDIPRYQEFTSITSALAQQGTQFVEIAGNSQLLVSLVAPSSYRDAPENATLLFSQPVLTHPEYSRFVLSCPITSLSGWLKSLNTRGILIEHVYDY